MLRTIRRIIRWTGPYKKRLYIGFFYSFLVANFAAMPVMAAAYTLGRVVADAR